MSQPIDPLESAVNIHDSVERLKQDIYEKRCRLEIGCNYDSKLVFVGIPLRSSVRLWIFSIFGTRESRTSAHGRLFPLAPAVH